MGLKIMANGFFFTPKALLKDVSGLLEIFIYVVSIKIILIYFRSMAKQVILTYVNHSQPLIPDGIHPSHFE